ncbi:hypothetical protein [Streptomyces platensis]|nr:hypothetical protein [Streptomyces platensis]
MSKTFKGVSLRGELTADGRHGLGDVVHRLVDIRGRRALLARGLLELPDQ